MECAAIYSSHPPSPSGAWSSFYLRWTVRELIERLLRKARKQRVHRLFLTIHTSATSAGGGSEGSDSDFAELQSLAGTLGVAYTSLHLYVEGEENAQGIPNPLRSSVVALARALNASVVSFYMGTSRANLSDDQLLPLAIAAPNASIEVHGGLSSVLLPHLASPPELRVREYSGHLRRLCARSAKKLKIYPHHERPITSADFAGLLEICTSAQSPLESVKFHVAEGASPELRAALLSKATKKALCNTPQYTDVTYFDMGTLHTHRILYSFEWDKVQKVKRGIRAFFSAAALANLPFAPPAHLFLNACGRDVKRKIAGYLI